MLTSSELKKITTEARPIIARQLEDADKLAGLRDVVSAAGGDWGQLKALIKAQIKDEDDEAGDGKHVRKILDKADYATAYADMLGLAPAKMNEQNISVGEDFDPTTGEIIDNNPPPENTPRAKTETDRLSGEHGGQTIHESPSNNDEASSAAAPQGEAVHSQGTGAETLAGREGRSEGQAASADLPTIQPATATESTEASESEPRLGQPTPGKDASWTVPQASHADNREAVTGPHRESGEIDLGATGGRQLQPALRTGVASGSVDPTPVDSGDTVEPDSGLSSSMQPEVAPIPSDLAETSMIEGEAESASGEAPDSSPPFAPAPRTLAEIAADMGYAADPHPDCRKPRICREFSHAGLCLDCRVAAGLETARAA